MLVMSGRIRLLLIGIMIKCYLINLAWLSNKKVDLINEERKPFYEKNE